MKRSSQLLPPNLGAKPKQATQLKFFSQLIYTAGAGPKGAAPAKKERLRRLCLRNPVISNKHLPGVSVSIARLDVDVVRLI